MTGIRQDQAEHFLRRCAERGVHIKWFGQREPAGFTSTRAHWRYIADVPALPRTAAILAFLCDMRIPLSLTEEDCRTIATIMAEAMEEARGRN